ncbi:MAG: MerC domain-containing protein [Novosphingobium sp.]
MRDAMLSIRDRLDGLGVALSGLCAVHCILSIVLVSTLGLGGEVLFDPSIHRTGLALAILVGVVTLGIGVLRHGRMSVLAIGAAGIALMAAGLAVQHGAGEAILTVAGVALVALAHIRNLRHSA